MKIKVDRIGNITLKDATDITATPEGITDGVILIRRNHIEHNFDEGKFIHSEITFNLKNSIQDYDELSLLSSTRYTYETKQRTLRIFKNVKKERVAINNNFYKALGEDKFFNYYQSPESVINPIYINRKNSKIVIGILMPVKITEWDAI